MNLETVPEDVLREILSLKEAETKLIVREKAQNKFMPFVHHVYENFIEGRHHRVIAEKLELIAQGKLKRLIINMPPRHTKSEFASFLFPAWFVGKNPKAKIRCWGGDLMKNSGGELVTVSYTHLTLPTNREV